MDGREGVRERREQREDDRDGEGQTHESKRVVGEQTTLNVREG